MSEDANEEVTTKLKKKVEGVTKDSVVTVITESNPKREGSKSYDRFESYFKLEDGATVNDAITAGLTMGDIHYDFIHGNINVEGAEVTEYLPTPRGAKSDDDAAAEGSPEVETETVEEEGF